MMRTVVEPGDVGVHGGYLRRWDAGVVALGWDDVPDAPARVGDIAVVSRDDMQVQMENRLARRSPLVEPDVVSGRAVLLIELALDAVDEFKKFEALLASG